MPQSNLFSTDTVYWFSFLLIVKDWLGVLSLLSLISGEVLRNDAIAKLKVPEQASVFRELLLYATASPCVTAFFIFWVRGTGDGVQQAGVCIWLCHVLANWSHSQPHFAHLLPKESLSPLQPEARRLGTVLIQRMASGRGTWQ